MDRVSDSIDFNIVTMGCKVNTYDTSLLELKLGRQGFKPSSQDRALVHVINSCAVTEKSSLETHRAVKKLKANYPESIVVITGCVAQVDVDRLKTLTGADLIIGNSHKSDFEKIIRDYIDGKSNERVFHSNIFKKDALDEGGGIESSRTRAFLKIQDGCNSFCSFCIIPFARGKSRSLTKDHLVGRVRDLHRQGFQEVVLTGVHCGDYDDEGLDYAGLIKSVIDETEIPRIRLSSLEPIEVTDSLWDLFEKNDRLCSHIHVSLQSANSKVLKDMRRKYGQNEIRKFFVEFKKRIPFGFVGMDVIVGFPGETDDEFEDTFEFLKTQPWSHIHVFPYSIRPGTTASKRTDHLNDGVIQRRAKRLRALSLVRQWIEAKKQIGTFKKVLVLEKPSHGAQGLSRDYWPIRLDVAVAQSHINQEIEVEITGVYEGLTSGQMQRSEPTLIGRLPRTI